MEARAEHQTMKRYNIIYTCANVIGVCAISMIVAWCISFKGGFSWNSDPDRQFNWHPVLMTLGMVILASQSILVYRTRRMGQKKVLKIAHAVIHLLSFASTVLGLKAVFDSHNYKVPPTANLYTMHSWIGLASVIIFSMNYVIGFGVFLFPGASTELRKAALPVHVAFGVGIFTTGLIAALMGLNEKAIWSVKDYSALGSEALLVNCIALFLVFYGLLVIHLVTEPTYKRLSLPEEEMVLHSSDN